MDATTVIVIDHPHLTGEGWQKAETVFHVNPSTMRWEAKGENAEGSSGSNAGEAEMEV